jgi:hypothetical protein
MKKKFLSFLFIASFFLPKLVLAQETVNRFCFVTIDSYKRVFVDMGRSYNHSIYIDSMVEEKVKWLSTYKKDPRGIDCAYIMNYMLDNGWTYCSSITNGLDIHFIFKRLFKKIELVNPNNK